MSKLTSQDQHKLNNYKGMSVGQLMSRARVDLGATIEDAAAHLNISSSHLEAIEADNVAALPAKVYAVGFVRAYADLLGLDSEKMAYLFKVQFYGKGQIEHEKNLVKPDTTPITIQEAVFQKENILPFMAMTGGGVIGFILFLLILGWLLWPSDRPSHIVIPDVPVELSQDEIIDAQNFVQTDNGEDKAVEPMDSIIKPIGEGKAYGGKPLTSPLAFKIRQDSWIEIRSLTQGKVLLSRTLKAGDVFYVGIDDDIILTTGNAGGIEAFLDGQNLGILGQEKEIIRGRPFSVEALRLRQNQ